MKIPPTTNLISSIRAQHNLRWSHLVAELVDNAKDAGATSVTLDFSVPGRFMASDDGCGCADLRLMLAAGHRQDHPDTQAGRYGIGGKEAIIWLADEVNIVSTSGGVKRSVHVDWAAVQASGNWEVEDPKEVPSPSPPGTTLLLSRLLHPLPTNFTAVRVRLGAIYAPAISSGAFRIFIRWRAGRGGKVHHESVPPAALPRLEREESGEFSFPHGRSARVRMGIISDPNQRSLQGVTIALPTRVIDTQTRIGLGADPTPGLYGYVELSRGWSLAKNKDDISVADKQFLGRIIADRFRHLIEAARKSGEDVVLAGCNRVLALIPTAIRRERDRNRKARRSSPANHTGTVIPTGLGGPHTRAARTQPGDRFRAPADPEGQTFRLQSDRMGKNVLFMMSPEGSLVTVNEDHAFYQHVKGNMDVLTPLAVQFLATQLRLLGGIQKTFIPELIDKEADKNAYLCSYFLERYVEAQKIAAAGEAAAV
jgi:hypothetical protein